MFIKSLSSEQGSFAPIKFHRGVNIITGERTKNTVGVSRAEQKTNGVGKTMLISLIDFCLLTEYKNSRVFKVPNEVLPLTDNVILEFESNNKNIEIRRSRLKESSPIISTDGISNHFISLDDAKQYLYSIVFGNSKNCPFRSYLRPFRRKEIIGFTEIHNPDGLKKLDISPYLRIFGVNLDLYRELTTYASLVDKYNKAKNASRKKIELLGISLLELEAHKNGLRAKLDLLNTTIEELSHKDIYETISDDISALDSAINSTNNDLLALKEEIAQLEKFPEYEEININDIRFVYNDCKAQLGDAVVRNIEEIQEFKNIIDSFKLNIINKRKDTLLSKKQEAQKKLNNLSKDYNKKISVLNKDGSLRSLKTALHEYNLKKDEFRQISFLHDQFVEQESNFENAEKKRDEIFFDMQENIKKQKPIINSFSKRVLELHHVLYGNETASFDIETKNWRRVNQKNFVFLHMEIDDSGSARSTHEKILIFDFSLLFCPETRKNHIGMLIHDGAFESINDDTKFQLLNWLHKKQEEGEDFQYLATINHDSFEALEEKQKFSFDLKSCVVAEYTKNQRFFRKKYVEKQFNK